MRGPKIALAVAAVMIAMACVPASARTHGGRGRVQPGVEATWLGKISDLVAPGTEPGVWNHADGYADGVIQIRLVGDGWDRRSRITRVRILTESDCWWRTTNDDAWGMAVTRPGGSRLLNIDPDSTTGPVSAIDLSVPRRDPTFNLNVAEPYGYPCLSAPGWWIRVWVTVDGVEYLSVTST